MLEKRTIQLWGDDSEEMSNIKEQLSEEYNVKYILTASTLPVLVDNGHLPIGLGNIIRSYQIRA